MVILAYPRRRLLSMVRIRLGSGERDGASYLRSLPQAVAGLSTAYERRFLQIIVRICLCLESSA
jgi:hypothetical protein